MIKLAPSILSADFSMLGQQVELVERAGAQYLHIDVMDGHFVPNISIGSLVVKSIRKHSSLVFDVHLMISHPLSYIEDFAKAGADIITVHYESEDNLEDCIALIKSLGKKAGVSIKPATQPQVLDHLLDSLDLVLVMSVEPGFGGQSYIDSANEKLQYLRNRASKNLDISVDGGINKDTIIRAVRSGANVIVAGNAIYAQPDISGAVAELIRIGEENAMLNNS